MDVTVVLRLTGCQGDLQGLKEQIAMDFEKYGNVRVQSIQADKPDDGEQLTFKEEGGEADGRL